MAKLSVFILPGWPSGLRRWICVTSHHFLNLLTLSLAPCSGAEVTHLEPGLAQCAPQDRYFKIVTPNPEQLGPEPSTSKCEWHRELP